MVSWNELGAFCAAAIVLLLIPGPSVLFVVTRGVTLGRRAAIATVAGNELGTSCHALAVAFGIGTIIQRSATVFNLMKLAGAAYLIYLGITALRGRRRLRDALTASVLTRSRRRLVWDGFLVGLGNPKTPLFFLAVLPQFVHTSNGSVTIQLLTLGMVFVAMAFVSDSIYGLAAGSVRTWLDRSPRRADLVGAGSGLVMVTLGVSLALSGRGD